MAHRQAVLADCLRIICISPGFAILGDFFCFGRRYLSKTFKISSGLDNKYEKKTFQSSPAARRALHHCAGAPASSFLSWHIVPFQSVRWPFAVSAVTPTARLLNALAREEITKNLNLICKFLKFALKLQFGGNSKMGKVFEFPFF